MNDSSPQPLRIGVLGAARITELSLVGPARTTGHRLVGEAARDRAESSPTAREWSGGWGARRAGGRP